MPFPLAPPLVPLSLPFPSSSKSQLATVNVLAICICAVVLPVAPVEFPAPIPVLVPDVCVSQKELLIEEAFKNPTRPPTLVLPFTLPVL